MKTFKKGALCVLFSVSLCTSFAQHHTPPISEPDHNKPKLFASLPTNIDVIPTALKTLFSAGEGEAVSIALGGAAFKGIVISKSDVSDKNVQSVVVRSTNYPGAAFTFTQIIDNAGNTGYKGRIISRGHSDAYELQVRNGQYQLVKRHQLTIISE